MYKAIIVQLKDILPIEGADNIVKATCLDFQVVVPKNGSAEGMLGIFFPTDGCFSHQMAYHNNLYRKDKGENKTLGKYGYLEADRRIKNLKLKKVLSEGIFLPLSSILWTGINPGYLKVGDSFDTLNGHKLAEKYFTPATATLRSPKSSDKPKHSKYIDFAKHYDTPLVIYYAHLVVAEGIQLLVTEKLHGTSGRTGNVLTYIKLPWYKQLWNDLLYWTKLSWTKLLFRPKKTFTTATGTRNTVLGRKEGDGYHSGNFRQAIHEELVGRLLPGEILYYEIVGYESPGAAPIMSKHHVPKDMDRAFKAQYGTVITYSYSQPKGTHEKYIYRITRTQDGVTKDLHWDEVVARCEELDLKTVPVLARFTVREGYLDPGEPLLPISKGVMDYIKSLAYGPSILDQTHPKEGVCIRLLNTPRQNFTLKYKSPLFSYMEGTLKEAPGYIDLEEIS
jgi:hypothetical protein